jgi:hypothetical protein
MAKRDIKTLIFVDCEANGKLPSTGKLTEFGAVAYPSRATFHGVLAGKEPIEEKEVFEEFEKWVLQATKGLRPIFVSENPAFDWQWINDGFWRTIGRNPFGWSASNDAMGNLEAFERLLNGER